MNESDVAKVMPSVTDAWTLSSEFSRRSSKVRVGLPMTYAQEENQS